MRKPATARDRAERNLLRLMLSDGTVVGRVRTRLDPEVFSDGMHRKLAGLIFERASTGMSTDAQTILAGLSSEESQKFVAGLTVEEMPEDSSDDVLDRLVATIRRDDITREIKEIQQQIEAGEQAGADEAALERLLTRQMELQRLLRRTK